MKDWSARCGEDAEAALFHAGITVGSVRCVQLITRGGENGKGQVRSIWRLQWTERTSFQPSRCLGCLLRNPETWVKFGSLRS